MYVPQVSDQLGIQFCGAMGYKAIKQRIQSSRIPLRHRHMVIATTLSVHRFALLWATRAEGSARLYAHTLVRTKHSSF